MQEALPFAQASGPAGKANPPQTTSSRPVRSSTLVFPGLVPSASGGISRVAVGHASVPV
jgi:hypothetical protein